MSTHQPPFEAKLFRDKRTGFLLDLTDGPDLSGFSQGRMAQARVAMEALEAGATANADEERRVGHYWLRSPELAPSPDLRQAIEQTRDRALALERGDHGHLLIIGIGGSALGPQLLWSALGTGDVQLHFMDNADPQGVEATLQALVPAETLVIVMSKSGSTAETMGCLQATQEHWASLGEPFAPHAIAVTCAGSPLDLEAQRDGWRDRFPLWDWVGGRTSITSAIGLVPMQLAGLDGASLLAGARAMDGLTRQPMAKNPAALLAASWHVAGGGRGDRALVILPYRDRLLWLSRYLQQLVMESLGKATDRQGRTVHQGLAVFGNKGSTDQHAIVQQLRDGRDDSLVHFVDSLDPGTEAHISLGDQLLGSLLGTRNALTERGRPSLSISIPRVDAHGLGMLIALFERAVGLYAELIDINAYHQPGVEAGKRGAQSAEWLLAQLKLGLTTQEKSAKEFSEKLDESERIVWRALVHLAHTGRARRTVGGTPADDRFSKP
jgi:glucose-6-phosphate isomerase